MINRILIVGLGSIGQRHLLLARELFPSADIRVLLHKSLNLVPEGSNGYFVRIEEAIAFAPQIAVVANPAPFHIATAQALANTGVHLLVEKPLSNSLSGVDNLLATCQKKKNKLLIGYNLRYLTSLQRFRNLIRERVIGQVLSVRCEVGQYLPAWRPDKDYRLGVSARNELGGGVLLELSHELDYLRWIFGEVDWVKATIGRQSNLEINVEDTAHLTLGFASVKDSQRIVGTVNLDFIRHDSTRLCTAIGESGSLRWNGLTGEVELFHLVSKEWHKEYYDSHSDNSYLGEWKHFISCVINQSTPLITGEDGLRVLEIVEAARLSAASDCTMQVAKS